MISEYYDFRENVKVEVLSDAEIMKMQPIGKIAYDETGKIEWILVIGELIKVYVSQFCELDSIKTGNEQIDQIANRAVARAFSY